MIKITAFLLLVPALLLAGGRTDPQQKALVLTHLTIIDVTGGAPKPDMTVVITGPRITDLGEAGKVDRKSTRLNSSHLGISYAVFCLKKKKNTNNKQ